MFTRKREKSTQKRQRATTKCDMFTLNREKSTRTPDNGTRKLATHPPPTFSQHPTLPYSCYIYTTS